MPMNAKKQKKTHLFYKKYISTFEFRRKQEMPLELFEFKKQFLTGIFDKN